MSSKNLFGENVIFRSYSARMRKNAKKNRKINIQRLSNFVSKTIKILFVEKQKRENLRKSFAFASAKYGGVGKSEQEWGKMGTWTLVPSLTLRASLQDNVR